MGDNWQHRSAGMRCATCISWVQKTIQEVPTATDKQETRKPVLGRCRKHAPTLQGWPVVFNDDWCGDHKIDEQKL